MKKSCLNQNRRRNVKVEEDGFDDYIDEDEDDFDDVDGNEDRR